MFRNKQVVNFNSLLEQMREGESAKLVLNRVYNYLHSCFEAEHRKFQVELDRKKDTDTFYDWYYPFRPFGGSDDIQKFAELVGYSLNADDKTILDEDWMQAMEHNKRAEELNE